MKIKFRLVRVTWRDSRQPVSRWQWIDDYENPNAVECVSVGWLISETKDGVAVAPNLGDVSGERMQISGVIEIPKSAIRRICNIRNK